MTCCESQGTRTFGALPEFIYSTSNGTGVAITDAVYVNLFVPSVYKGDGFTLVQKTGFPSNGTVSVAMAAGAGAGAGSYGGISSRSHGSSSSATAAPKVGTVTVMLRIPSWCQAAQVSVVVKDGSTGSTVNVFAGYPGTYLKVELADAHVLEMNVPMALRTSVYNGTQPMPVSGCTNPADAVRAAVEWGPILLAATHSPDPKCSSTTTTSSQPASNAAVTIVGVDPRNTTASAWLVPAGFDGVDPLFTVAGTKGCTVFRPYYSMDQGGLSVYPVFLPSAAENATSTCGIVKENYPAETSRVCVSCPAGKTISAIANAQFGLLNGNCTAGIVPGACTANASNVKAIVEGLCLGARQCSVPVDVKVFGNVCTGMYKSLAVSVDCGVGQCDMVSENWPLETNAVTVGCPPGHAINSVVDAEFGLLAGSCAATSTGFKPAAGGCIANRTRVKAVVASMCVGNQTCTVPANLHLFGKIDPCPGKVKELAVRVECTHALNRERTQTGS